MDSYLSIAGLALSIAGLVPALYPRSRTKLWTFTTAVFSLLVLIGIYQVYQERVEQRAIQASKSDILALLEKNKNGMSFEQMYDSMYYPNFATANSAIDELVEDGRVVSEKIEASTNDAKYVVRKFSLRRN